jgi:hypothetical protein
VSYIWFPLLWGWRLAFFVYRFSVCPNPIDAIGFAVGAIIVGRIFKLFPFLAVLLIATLCLFIGPTLSPLTPVEKWIQKLIASLKSMNFLNYNLFILFLGNVAYVSKPFRGVSFVPMFFVF